MRFLKLIIIVFALAMAFTGCKKEVQPEPEVTENEILINVDSLSNSYPPYTEVKFLRTEERVKTTVIETLSEGTVETLSDGIWYLAEGKYNVMYTYVDSVFLSTYYKWNNYYGFYESSESTYKVDGTEIVSMDSTKVIWDRMTVCNVNNQEHKLLLTKSFSNKQTVKDFLLGHLSCNSTTLSAGNNFNINFSMVGETRIIKVNRKDGENWLTVKFDRETGEQLYNVIHEYLD